MRWCGHVGHRWDMDVGVMRRDELKDWIPKDPVARARATLEKQDLPAGFFDRIEAQVRDEIADAVEFARSAPYPDVGELLQHVYVAR